MTEIPPGRAALPWGKMPPRLLENSTEIRVQSIREKGTGGKHLEIAATAVIGGYTLQSDLYFAWLAVTGCKMTRQRHIASTALIHAKAHMTPGVFIASQTVLDELYGHAR